MKTAKYKYAKENTQLLSFHMNCNPDYLFGHAIVAGKLAKREYQTYQEYLIECGRLGISCYNEECFDKFMETN